MTAVYLESSALLRLHALVRRGYVPELGRLTASDSVFLSHPGRRASPSTAILYADGTFVGLDSAEFVIRGDAGEAFTRFLGTVRLPTWWERTREARGQFIAWCITVLPFFVIAGWGVLERLSR